MSDTSVNVTNEEAPAPKPPTLAEQVRTLLATEVTDQNTALSVLVGFVGIAQRRRVFAIDESAKIYECIKSFQGEKKE